ncbi:MAG: DUF917 domain-containing protein [Actinomycetota bacterium]
MQLGADDLVDYAQGCAILGSGGGGDVDGAVLQAQAAIAIAGPVAVVNLDDLDDDALVMPVAGWGAPTVGIEKLGAGSEGSALAAAVQRWFGRPIAAVMAGEIGGGNGVLPVAVAAELGLPLVDADGMGRAFPEGPQVAMHVAGLSPAPAFLADEYDNLVTLEPSDGDWFERLARAVSVAFGGVALGADHVMSARTARTATVRSTVTLASALGLAARAGGVQGVLTAGAGVGLITGKVVDLQRRTTGGFARGEVTLAGTRADAGRTVTIHVQNENLLATEGARAIAIVPDLIVLLDEATGAAVPTERVRYGQRLTAVGLPCAPVWRTPAGLAIGGPDTFGFPHAFTPVEELTRG